MDLSLWIERNARFAPQRCAVRFAGHDISYGELAVRIERAAAALAGAGVRAGDVVAYLGLNHPVILELLFACARLGALIAPLNWRLAPPEIRRTLEDCRPRVLVAAAAFVASSDAACPPADTQRVIVDPPGPPDWTAWEDFSAAAPAAAYRLGGHPQAPLLLCYTSGTTGTPKGVVLDQGALLYNAINSAHMHDLVSQDRILTTIPMFHVGGLNIQTLPALHAGATVTLHPRFEAAAALETIEREQITLTVLVPAQLTSLLDLPGWSAARVRSLRMITTGSTIISAQFAHRINAFGVPLAQVYGSTETAPVAAYQRAADALERPGSAGAPALHCELQIIDGEGRPVPVGVDGEILVRGRNLMCGYLNNPELTAAVLRDGWYHTGDYGHLDAGGFLYVVARQRDMIITGGENVYPEEIESALLECPGIAEVCVIGRPDERLGERVIAAVVPCAGAGLEAPAVLAFLQGRIARYKHPREVHFFADLPRTPLGKLLRAEVRERILGDRTGSGVCA
ncbi:MAG: AMP-binding protein [Gammaproteobacteria bacterium]|nr:AMP-binding protein [Gammaproteobacteria bacterium]